MKILVTGGSGIVGEAAVAALIGRGHEVRLLARGAEQAARDWPPGVEPFPADVAEAASLMGAADGCQAVLHVAGIEREEPPQRTFDAVNVAGTAAVLAEATRAGVPRFVFVSSLGADTGASAYHVSKRAAENLVRAFAGDWLIVRPGGLYGPGDAVLSTIVKLVRALPAIPVIAGGQEFQPLWHEDAGEALAAAVERTDLSGLVLEVAGPDITSMPDLLDRLAVIEGRDPLRIGIPGPVARLAARAAGAVGLPFPVDDTLLQMLRDGNVVRGENALLAVLAVEPTPLSLGLRKLMEALPEQPAQEGRGPLRLKRYWADIDGGCSPQELRTRFLSTMADMLPLEGGPPAGRAPRVGSTFKLDLPLRGVIQMRMAEKRPDRVTFLTTEGHPLAGALSFRFQDRPRFEIEIQVRSATMLDAAGMAALGGAMQDAAWVETVERVVGLSGGTAPAGVQQDARDLSADEAQEAERWMAALISRRKRSQRAKKAAQPV